ncbi:MAG: TlpA family protein disulfide reductase [Bacteroidetes bacterium]|jgi:thiol-disulfide isomerase/thioredoxin|nr:TlpA family protein disulfide reductase [Bacteroidota bacterium]MBT3750971.1 TlpA family protein disulfide reductase [Bacteroidota bacterium]MBT4399721.1 TlpA family protein disulfide reductase [Bacteroidota bacterium]MBT4409644.1 TlpA family protein disulfide reductase [Bacteroidota bacterium]MBT5426308.1 TlpA family protein disulfide reductase [Bacteroidota bacterium]
MKKLFLLLSAIAILAGCQQAPDNVITITGTLLNPDSSDLVFFVDRDRDTVELTADGAFVFERESEKPLSINVMFGRKRASLWAAPGKSLDVNIDVADWDNSIGFTGDLQLTNEYLIEKGLVQMGWSRNFMANFLKEPDEFLSARDSLQKAFDDVYLEYKSNGMDKLFCDYEEIVLLYTMYGDLNNYPNAHRYYAKLESYDPPADWFDFTDGMDLNDPLLIEVDQAMYFLSSFINTEAVKAGNLGDDAWGTPELLNAKFKYIDDNFEMAEMIERFKFENLEQQLDAGPPTGAEEAIDLYLAASTNEENTASIIEKRDAWAAIEAGQPAVDWTLVDIDGNEVSQSDFAGKYVYIDFWATWCGPCLAEIPHYKELVKEYEGRNIVFISVSVDKDKPAWEKMVKEEQFPWVQLHDANNMNDEYLVRYIPSFILIDNEGNIIDPRAPRPSTDKLREMLNAQAGL